MLLLNTYTTDSRVAQKSSIMMFTFIERDINNIIENIPLTLPFNNGNTKDSSCLISIQAV